MTNPIQDCDLVMRGGIASGVVYPTAVHEIAKKYRLRSIGGTSAGAIAAVAAAAAEHARQKAAAKVPREGADTDPMAQFKDALNATLHFVDTHEKLGKSQLAKAAPKPRPRLTMGPPSA